ncbi:MAG: hypothetical protein ACKPI8_04710 [Microcystis panniformis]
MNSNVQVILVSSSNTSSVPAPSNIASLNTLILNGGIAIVVIIGMAYFTKVQLKSIANLLKKLDK